MWLLVVKFASLILLTKTALSLDAPCSSTWFDCENGKCIAGMWLCDGDNDCGNLKDEEGCELAPRISKCLTSQFECLSDEHCIPEKWHCDGEKDCDDGSDEIKCDNMTEQCTGFSCRDHHCIPAKWQCDGNADCADGSDEELCSPGKLCSDSEFSCSSGSCINESLLCNGKKDCADGSDEGSHCGDPCENATCSQNCRNTPSGPECFCNHGYILESRDNKTCLDINECLQEGFCSHQCTNTPGSYRCSCQRGYELVNRTCQATGADPLLVFTTLQEIRGMHLRSNTYFLIRRSNGKASAVDVDPKSQRIYWVEVSNRSSIYSSKTDGSDLGTVLSHGLHVPEDIAVDYVANNLYLTDSGLKQVLVCKMDGTMCNALHDINIGKPRSIVLDPAEGFLYWSDWGDHTSGIYRSGMDGSRRIPFVSGRIAWPNGIAIDHSTNRMYWADAKLNTIEYITLDGKSRKTILNATVFHPYSLAVFEDTIYWTDWASFSLETCNKFTGHQTTLLARENGRHMMGVHVYHPILMTRALNPCWGNDCSHMCLIAPGSGFTCACSHGFALASDGRTCSLIELTEAVFVSEGSSVFYMRPKAVGSETITELPLAISTAIISRVAFDKSLRFLFVADLTTPAIHAVNMTSLHMRFLVRNDIYSPEDLSFDWRSNNLYWIDSSKGTLEAVSVDSFKRAIILENLMAPVALAISPESGKMFIATIAARPSVSMYDMDGKNRRMLRSIQGVPISLALHPTKPLLYWADPSSGTVSFMNYTNSRSPRIVTTRIDGVMSVAVSADYVYWTSRRRELNQIKANVTYVLQLPGQEKGAVTRKVTYNPGASTSARSQCLIGNGGCSYLCLTSPNGRTCACPSELVLGVDNVTCEARKCDDGDFKCMNGQCLPHELRCDGSKNCEDGSDETGCSLCSGDDFQCKNGKCILKSWQCDRRDDCEDNSDEQNCPPSTNCTSDQIACMNGECVPVLWRCDGEADCEDGTDEVSCNATRCDSDSHYRCDSGQCIPVSWVCDRAKDCLDNSDERNCSKKLKTCKPHEFKCEADERCIDALLRCDGREDCYDGSDEKNCPRSHRDCKKGMYPCSDGSCIYDYEVCDGHNDCRHNEDESNCTQTTCDPEEIFCPSPKRCLLKRWICDGDLDCNDGRDEQNCMEQKTQPKPTPAPIDSECREFYCYSSNQCLPWSRVCDGRQDCRDLPDEGGKCSQACYKNGGCSQTCIKTPHGPQCSCNEGFRLLPDNKTCDDVDECHQLGTCSHFCNNTKGSFKCSCAEGYVLQDNHRHCKAEGGSAVLVYLLGDQIRGYNLTDNSTKVYLNMENADMKGMDYDASTGIFFWTESYDGSINSYSLQDNQTTVILKSSARPTYVRYDWMAKNLYFRDESSRIGACTVDGKYCKVLIDSPTIRIDSMDISPTSGFMFWTTWETRTSRSHRSGLIERAEMDGSHRLAILFRNVVSPTGITVDHVMNMIYWSDKLLNTLESADFYGFQRRQVVQSKVYHPQAVTLFEDFVYWADWGSDSIIGCNKFIGRNCSKIIPKNIKTNILMAVHNVMQPHSNNKCLNSNCPFMCLPTRLSFVCACDGSDNSTCSLDPVAVASPSGSECPEHYCQGDADCVVQAGEYICKCKPPYTGKTCEVKAAATVDSYSYSYGWVAVIFAILLAGMIVLGILLCIRNREKLQRMSETVSVKFRSPKSGDGRLVMDTDDGSLCEELVLGQDGDYKRARGNSDYTAFMKDFGL